MLGEVAFDLTVLDGRLTIIDQVYLGLDNVQSDDLIVLCEEYGIRESDVAGAGDGDVDLHGLPWPSVHVTGNV
ncbi:hypothetical protein D3C85_1533030 [compost metagenome]